jgi:hypothetical protein
MNARRVHEFMRERFPVFDAAAMEWRNVSDAAGARLKDIDALLAEHLRGTEAIVEVNRKLGAALPIEEAAAFIGAHIGLGQIQVTNREASGFVVVAASGVACGWHAR